MEPEGNTLSYEQEDEDSPLQTVLEFCQGQIVQNVPNIQLMHMMMVYGQCCGGEGMCVETTQSCQLMQNRIYDKYMRSLVATLSPALSSNMQSVAVPHTWTDIFCRILLDSDAHISGDAEVPALIERILQTCNLQCFELRLMDAPSTIQLLPSPSSLLDDNIVSHWALNVFEKWVCSFYECYSLWCFESMRLPSPVQMGLNKNEFRDWQAVVHGVVTKRLKDLKALHSENRKQNKPLFKLLQTCWLMACTLHQDLLNLLLFYISYAVRRNGEEFLSKKMKLLRSGKLPEAKKMLELLSAQDNLVANRILASSSCLQLVPLVSNTFRARIKAILLCGCTAGEVAMGQNNASMQIVQFAHGFIHALTQKHTQQTVESVCMLDRPGIHGVCIALNWVSHLITVLPRGYEAIHTIMHSSEEHKGSMRAQNCVAHLQALQAFTELVLRTAQFRIFGTGKKNVVDACNMLLRTAGLDLANRLLEMLSLSSSVESGCCMDDKTLAMHTISNVMSAWMGITIVTTAGSQDQTDIVKASQQEFVQDAHGYDDNTSFGRVAHCILAYVRPESHGSESPVAGAPISPSTSSTASFPGRLMHNRSVEDADHIPLPLIPRMYLQSTLQLPIFGEQSGLSNNSDEEEHLDSPHMFCDPSVPRRQDSTMCHVWDFCWENLARGTNEGMRMCLFRPLLMHVAIIARNMIKANALYSIDHVITCPSKVPRSACLKMNS